VEILLFGGSFDPPHRGHAELLSAALRAVKPGRAYVLPAHRSPLKSAPRTPPGDRLAMTRAMLGAAGLAGSVKLDLSEMRRPRATFTYETVRLFRSRHPGARIWFLAGSDSLASFEKWKRPGELRRLCRWVVGVRPGFPLRRGPSLPRALRLPGRFPAASSTDIRCGYLTGTEKKGALHPAVRRYIEKRGLYGLDVREELKKTLTADRYGHTLEVARLACRLARLHRLDFEAAAWAGLLHDAGRRFSPIQMARYTRRRGLRVPHREEIIRNAPVLLHAFISADLAERRFGVRDGAIVSAVRNHTLGQAGMPVLDRLLYAADAGAEDRSFPEAARIRGLARASIDRAFLEAVRTKIDYVSSTGQWLHPGAGKLESWAERLAAKPRRAP